MKRFLIFGSLYIPVFLLMTSYSFSCIDQSCNYAGGTIMACPLWQSQVHLGLCPVVWPDAGKIMLDNCICTSTDSLKLSKFNKLFHVPLIVGGQLAYSRWSCFSLYAELNYLYARGKTKTFTPTSGSISAFTLKIGNYNALSVYAGVRYNAKRIFCDTTDLFVGAKLGLIHRFTVSALQDTTITTTASQCSCNDRCKQEFFKKTTDLSAGINFGFDTCIYKCWSLIFTGEIVAHRGPRGTCFFPLVNSEITINDIKAEISFPITIGLRYSF